MSSIVFWIIVLISCFFNSSAFAAKYVATIAFAKGDVKVIHQKPKRGKKYKSVLYEGKATTYEKGRVGKKVRAFDIIHNGPNAKTKVIYANGDHFIIGPGSSVQMPGKGKKSKKPTLNMFYGKIRSMISKNGELKNFRVKTKTTVAGVRGTDFYVVDDGVEKTKVTVLRGKVAVSVNPEFKEKTKTKNVKKGLPTTLPKKEVSRSKKIDLDKTEVLKAGYSIEVKKKEQVEEIVKIQVYEAPQKELLNVQKASLAKIDLEALKKIEVSKEVKEQIQTLEKKAKIAVLEDIKVEDKELYEEIKEKDVDSLSEINTAVVSKLFKKAPKEVKEKSKITEGDINDIGGDDVYDKYFRQ